MIAISYVAKNNLNVSSYPQPLPPPPLSPCSLTSLRAEQKNIFIFFVEVIKHCNIIRSFHCLIVILTLYCDLRGIFQAGGTQKGRDFTS